MESGSIPARSCKERSPPICLCSRPPNLSLPSTCKPRAHSELRSHQDCWRLPMRWLSKYLFNNARPNGNLTGFANWDSPAISGKWLELLKEVAPQVERIGFMMHPETPAHIRYFKSAEALAPALKVKLVALGVHDADEIERAMAALAAEGNGGVIVGPHAVTLTNRDLIVALAARLRLPALYPLAFYAKAGGLISYGFDPVNQFQQGAGYVDRILRGAKPADLPVQHPTKLQLVVHLKTAKTLGLAIPESFLLRADEVIA